MEFNELYSDFVQKAENNKNQDKAMLLLGLSGEVSRLSSAIGLNNLDSQKLENRAEVVSSIQRIFEHLFLLCSKTGLDIDEVVSGIGGE